MQLVTVTKLECKYLGFQQLKSDCFQLTVSLTILKDTICPLNVFSRKIPVYVVVMLSHSMLIYDVYAVNITVTNW